MRKNWSATAGDVKYEAEYLAEPTCDIQSLHNALVDLIGYAAAAAIERNISKTATNAETIDALKIAIRNAAQSTVANLTDAITAGDAVTEANGFSEEQEAAAEQQVRAVTRRSRQPGFEKSPWPSNDPTIQGLYPNSYSYKQQG